MCFWFQGDYKGRDQLANYPPELKCKKSVNGFTRAFAVAFLGLAVIYGRFNRLRAPNRNKLSGNIAFKRGNHCASLPTR